MSEEVEKRPPLPCFAKPFAAPEIYDPGCCGPKGRIQWVIAFDYVLGICGLIWGAAILSSDMKDTYNTVQAGLNVATACLLIPAGSVLWYTFSKKKRIYCTVWLVLSGLFLPVSIAQFIFSSYATGVNAHSLFGFDQQDLRMRITLAATIAVYVLFVLLRILCIVGVVKHRARMTR